MFLASQILLWVEMVTSVSPSCTKIEAKSSISSLESFCAIVLATAVIETVSSHAFIVYHPDIYYVGSIFWVFLATS